eukprot:11871870-Heterocapsa_arctica.AAC.1
MVVVVVVVVFLFSFGYHLWLINNIIASTVPQPTDSKRAHSSTTVCWHGMIGSQPESAGADLDRMRVCVYACMR